MKKLVCLISAALLISALMVGCDPKGEEFSEVTENGGQTTEATQSTNTQETTAATTEGTTEGSTEAGNNDNWTNIY